MSATRSLPQVSDKHLEERSIRQDADVRCRSYAPFMHAAWTDPSTLKIVSDIAGVDLIPVYDYDIGNINIAVMDPNDALKKTADNSADEMPVTKWHVDSYPFVCVVMMSDTTNMVGGETAVKTGTGEVLKIRGPSMVSPITLHATRILSERNREAPLSSKADTSRTRLLQQWAAPSASP